MRNRIIFRRVVRRGIFPVARFASHDEFHADLVEGDATARWESGHVSAFGGYARYGDNDPAADNGRDIFYYSVEGVQDLPKKFYAAARFSEIYSAKGVPIVGYGNSAEYFSDLTHRVVALESGHRLPIQRPAGDQDGILVRTRQGIER
jgi:hypothetical protein